jgi:hypothetical protein
LNEEVIAKEINFPPQNTGDGGLDLVAWVPPEDGLSSNLIVTGQCACTSEWVTKQHSSGANVWRDRIAFKATPTNVAFIPFLFRSTDGTWHNDDYIHDSVLIDRLRLMRLLRDRKNEINTVFRSCPAHRIVEQVLEYEEPVF